ncbi:hypothetical protein CBOM_00924 [Ceraceosorus bombacis]|uniref:ICE2-domain-containing protein n=1 Tax=Ceraceosorus bombacis TaxID=401625 RepID=A0A0P1BAV9_9BASI|nr:hypothetical protein CBOM_00924 [Ceraceosorus bombacis]
MSVVWSICVAFGRITTLLQVILYLPLTLDVAGVDAFLALSASLACYYFFLSSIRALVKGTSLAWLGTFLATFQFLVVPACLLVVFNVYSPPSSSYFSTKPQSRAGAFASALGGDNSSVGAIAELRAVLHGVGLAEGLLGETVGIAVSSVLEWIVEHTFWLARAVPPWWHTLLRWSSPAFSLLEGISTLLVIQVLGSLSRYIIAASLSSPPSPRRKWLSWLPSFGLGGAEGWQLLFLVSAAFVYVSSAVALYLSFDGATRNRPGAAAATGAAVSSTLWLTAIAFAVRKGNVIETSLMFGYVVWNVYQLADSLAFTADPLALIRSFKTDSLVSAPLPPLILASATALFDLAGHTLGHSARFIAAAGAALPKSVIVSLVYRLMVLYAASRILPVLKAAEGAWRDQQVQQEEEDSGSETDEELRMDGMVKGKAKEGVETKLLISIIVSYSRLLLIAVYSHLLLLDQSHMTVHRFLAVGTALTVWSFELVLGDSEEGMRNTSW